MSDNMNKSQFYKVKHYSMGQRGDAIGDVKTSVIKAKNIKHAYEITATHSHFKNKDIKSVDRLNPSPEKYGLPAHKVVNEETELDETVLNMQQRQKRAQIMRRFQPKIERAREIAKKRMAPQENIKKRAYAQARHIVRTRVAGQRGAEYEKLGPTEKMAIDRAVEGKQKIIKRLALRLIPRVKAAEQKRLSTFMHGKSLVNHGQPEGSGSSSVKESFNNIFAESFPPVAERSKREQPAEMDDSKAKKSKGAVVKGNQNVIQHGKFDEAIAKKSAKSGISEEVLKEVYNRGIDAWTRDTGVSSSQYAFARMNSFINKGKTYFNEDADLQESNNTPFVKPHIENGATKQSGWKASNKHGKVKYFGKEFKSAAQKHAGLQEVALDEGTKSPYHKAALAMRNAAFGTKNEMDKTNLNWHADLLKSHDPEDHKLSSTRMAAHDTYLRDAVSDIVHKNSSKVNSDKYHKMSGVTRLKEEAKATPCGRCGTTHVSPANGGKCPGAKKGVDEAFTENFIDGKGPGKPGDSARHGLKGKSAAELKSIRSSDSASPRKKQLAHFMLNMTKNEETELDEDLRKWFSQKWVRMNTKGEIKGDCAREDGEGKPKCLPQAKAHAMDKQDRAKAVRRKRREDPVANRVGKGGKPVNVATEGYITEKSAPTNPALWSRAKSLARSKFDVYPSAYANGWAAKYYKSKGGGWKTVSESLDEGYDVNTKHYKALTDLDLNTENRDLTIKHGGYGPINPNDIKGSKTFWNDKASLWGTTMEAAMEARCHNCAAFNQAPAVMKKMAEGLGPAGDKIQELSNLGFCELFEFKCAGDRTCSRWLVNGPITEESEGTKARKKIEKVDRNEPHNEYGKQSEIQKKIIDEEGNSQPDSKKRLIGTDSLVKAYKKDTPGQTINESFNIEFAAGVGVTLTANDLGMKIKSGFELHPSVIDDLNTREVDDEMAEEVRSSDIKGVVIHTASGKTVLRKQKVNRKIIGTGNLTDGKPDDTV